MVSAQKKTIIDVIDYTGKRVIFTIKKLKAKAIQHPELNKPAFIKRVGTTLVNPDEVWQDYDEPRKRRCFYKKYSMCSYAKVVVYCCCSPSEVVTAYEINYVKEQKYPGLKQLR